MTFPYLFLIPLIPLISSIVIRLFGNGPLNRKMVHFLACGSVGASFLITLAAFFSLQGGGEPLHNSLFPWISAGHFTVWWSFLFDSLSAVMSLIVTGVGFLIHVYSTGYMSHEKDYHRFFAYLNLFMAMMLILVLGDSVLLMFVGWEGVGLCSYLLIGFWFGDNANADAGKKAFVVNRVGDFGFIIGIMTLFWALGLSEGIWSLDYSVMKENIDVYASGQIFGVSLVGFATLMLFVGAIGKSAQIPLYVWLPDAMAGPTPVSALIHAATMVTAGVYMIARLSFLFDLAPGTLTVIATVGACTALFAATIGLVQNDIKKVLAYSTVSQLGYMFLACGVGAYAAGIFHVMTHAFFKALLFLGAGSVIHAMSGEQDMRNMGGLKDKIPVTFKTMFIATLAISGIPGLAGFFSKDLILYESVAGHYGNWGFWIVGVCAAGMTAFYMFRLLYMTFYGECRADEKTQSHIHESPKNMTLPLIALAGLSILGGYLWLPPFFGGVHLFPDWLASGGAVVFHAHEEVHMMKEILLASISVVVALAGILLARHLFKVRPEKAAQLALRHPKVHKVLLNKYYVDELYGFVFVRGTKILCAIAHWFDAKVIDEIVNGSAWALKLLSFIDGTIDRFVVDGIVNAIGNSIVFFGRRVRRFQSGQIQMYLGTLAGVFVVITLFWVSVMKGK